MQIPSSAKTIMERLAKAGYRCYLVGGCVRDQLLKRPVHDYDMTTDALPDVLLDLFQEYPLVTSGSKHGTIGIVIAKEVIEVTTHRKESAYLDHRHPHVLTFTDSLQEDLSRRDFTINAMAYDQADILYDPYHGLEDLKKKQIVCVGDPDQRFQEDALRIMRAIRFSMQLGFVIEEKTAAALKKNVPLLKHVAKERLRDEFHLMLESNSENLLGQLEAYGVLTVLFPLLASMKGFQQDNPWHPYDLLTHTDIALSHSKNAPLIVKLALCFHDCGKLFTRTYDDRQIAHYHGHAAKSAELADAILKAYRYPTKMRKDILLLITYHDYYMQPKDVFLRRFLSKLDNRYPLAFAILQVQYADDCAKNPALAKDKLDIIRFCRKRLEEMQKEPAIHLHDLAINGHDIAALGYQGKAIGEIKKELLDHVIAHPDANQRDTLIAYLKEKEERHE